MATTDFVIDDDKLPIVRPVDGKIHSLKNKKVKKRYEFGMTQKMFFFVTVPMAIAAIIYIAHGIIRIIESAK